MKDSKLIPLSDYCQLPEKEMIAHAASFYCEMRKRRSVRSFSDRAVPREVIEYCLRAAGTAPSGANMQPWHFVVVENPALKRDIRQTAEQAERQFYNRRATDEFLDALVPLGTNASKPFLGLLRCLIHPARWISLIRFSNGRRMNGQC
jgi:nitroreductase